MQTMKSKILISLQHMYPLYSIYMFKESIYCYSKNGWVVYDAFRQFPSRLVFPDF